LEKATDKLPGWASTVAKNALITKDTALFQGLNRMVQYGDFISKAVLYDHLMKDVDKNDPDAFAEAQTFALEEIMEEFVQYNRLPGRSRDFLESNGLLWFWNYKLRIMKVAGKMMRDRPVHSLLAMGSVGPQSGVDTVWSGSLAGNIADGSWDYSVGPMMGIQSMTMNPYYNATY